MYPSSCSEIFGSCWWAWAAQSGVGPSPCVSVDGGWGSEAYWEQDLGAANAHYWLQRPAGPPLRAAGSAAE